MTIIKLKEVKKISIDGRLNEIYYQFDTLLSELRKKELPESIIQLINNEVEELNKSNSLINNELRKLIKKKQNIIIRLIEKELKIVPQKFYRNLWLALGMTAFGIPLGVIIGVVIGTPGLFALGLPFGVLIGLTVGTAMDKKAFKENRQLNLEIKY